MTTKLRFKSAWSLLAHAPDRPRRQFFVLSECLACHQKLTRHLEDAGDFPNEAFCSRFCEEAVTMFPAVVQMTGDDPMTWKEAA